MLNHIWLLPLGFIIGAFGTLIGAGGGFILVPLLLLLYPKENPEIITSISLAVVFFNALSGSVAYNRMKRIDFKSGVIFAAATIPGAVLGALSTSYIPRRIFDLVFGFSMILAAIYLWISAGREGRVKLRDGADRKPGERSSRLWRRSFVDTEGIQYRYAFNPVAGIVLSLFVGFVSSLLGVGGGFIHVPALVRLLNFPVHVATATSHFILVIMALTGTLVHVASGTFAHGVRRTFILTIGVVIGAQLGASFSNRVRGPMIIRGLALALAFVGVRIIFMEL